MRKIGHFAFYSALLLAVGVMFGCQKEQTQQGSSTTAPTSVPASGPAASSAGVGDAAENWPQFRGPWGDGIASSLADPPAELNLAEQLRWKVAVPAEGNNSPIIWGDRIFLTGKGQRIMAFDRATGKLLWNTAVTAPPAKAGQEDASDESQAGPAAPTACTDGQRVFAFFGSGVLGCVDMNGKQLWANRLTDGMENGYGLAASPIVHNGLVIQVVDVDPREPSSTSTIGRAEQFQSFVVAFRAAGGQQAWRTGRPVGSSWPTPLIVGKDKQETLVTCAKPWVIGYNPISGDELWRMKGLVGDVASSPIASNGLIYAVSDPQGPVLAFRAAGASGELDEKNVAWTTEEDMPNVSSPICDGQRYIQIKADSGIIHAYDAAKGTPLWEKEIENIIVASPVLAAGRLYMLDNEGNLYVLSPKDGSILSQAKLNQPATASPAVIGKYLYIRGEKDLFCIGPKG